MAIVRALDGTFYEVPDDQLGKFKIPAEKLKEKLGDTAPTEGPPPEGPPSEGGSPLVNVQIYYSGQGPAGAGAGAEGAVSPYDWRRHWRRDYDDWNRWRRHWD